MDGSFKIRNEVESDYRNVEEMTRKGFWNFCKKYNVCAADGTFPSAMLVKELIPGALDGRRWVYHQSPAFDIDERAMQLFEETFEKMEKAYQPSQEMFYIHSNSILR